MRSTVGRDADVPSMRMESDMSRTICHPEQRAGSAPSAPFPPRNVAVKTPGKVATHGADTPMERPGQPEEVAPSYVYFASNADSSYITGEVLTLPGGKTTAA